MAIGLIDACRSEKSLGLLLLDRDEFPHCQHIYKCKAREQEEPVDSCPACKAEIRERQPYLPMTIITLIDLIQDFYRLEVCRTDIAGTKRIETKKDCHYIGVIILFCTLVECWQAQILSTANTSRNLRLDEWKSSFKKRTKVSFGDALKDIAAENKKKGKDYIDYKTVWDFFLDANKARNDIVHKGIVNVVYNGKAKVSPKKFAQKCLESIKGVNEMFISLHNRYICAAKNSKGQERLK